jgi:head-tail adaptor
VRAGDLTHTVTIVAPAGVAAATETEIERRVPAAITPVPVAFQSKEGLAAGGMQSATTYVVSVRYRTDVSPAYVLVEECHTRRRFQVVAIVPTDRADAIDMTCVTAG